MAFVAAPVAPFTTPAGKAAPINADLVRPVVLTIGNPQFRSMLNLISGNSTSKPYGYAIT